MKELCECMMYGMLKFMAMEEENRDKDTENQRMKINVGGTVFETFRSTLSTFPETKLAKLKPTDFYDCDKDEYFFDRNPILFAFILEACRVGELHLPQDVCGKVIRKELEFWEFDPVILDKCCWRSYYQHQDDFKITKQVEEVCEAQTRFDEETTLAMRQRIWLFLDEPRSSKLALTWGIITVLLVCTSFFIFTGMSKPGMQASRAKLETENFNRTPKMRNFSRTEKMRRPEPWQEGHIPWWNILDIVCNAIITVDVILRVLSCPNVKTFVRSYLAVTDALSTLAFWVYTAFMLNLTLLENAEESVIYLQEFSECFLILKIFRVFRLCKYIPSLRVMVLSVKACKEGLIILALSMVISVFVFGSLIYVVEGNDQDAFKDIFVSMWWAVVTITTVGYGDKVPKSHVGYVIGSVCAICGIMMLSLPIALITSYFTKFQSCYSYTEKHIKRKRMKRLQKQIVS